jgi:hypothetical protein
MLGLEEDASAEEIEKAYDILLRRKMQQQREGKDAAGDALFRTYTEAYRFLKGELDVKGQSAFGRFFNFIRYKAGLIIVLAIIALLAAAIVKQSFFPAKTDLAVQICGEVHPRDLGLDALADNLKAALPEMSRIKLGVTPLRHDAADSISLTNSNKIFIDISIGRLDVFLLDQYLFEKYASSGIFMDLGAAADEIGVPEAQRFGMYAKAESDAAETLYGIDISGSKLLSDSGIEGDRKIFVIVDRSAKKNNAIELLKYLIPEKSGYRDGVADPG